MPKNQDIVKSVRHLYSGIKTELETVYVTSSGDKYLEEMDAICAEAQFQQTKELKEKRRNKIMGIVEMLFKVLKEENWGIYYKNNPMRSLATQEGGTLYEINTVDLDEVERVLLKKLNTIKEGQEDNCTEHTAPHSQQEEDSSQKTN